jgi:hypothetical protein
MKDERLDGLLAKGAKAALQPRAKGAYEDFAQEDML